MIRRALTSTLALGLTFGALGAAEAKPSAATKRTIHGSYGAYPTPVTACNEPTVTSGTWACLIVQTRANEAFFTAEVKDAHGQPVQVNVYSAGHHASFCGKTDRPIPIRPGSTLEFDIGQGRAPFTPLPCPQHIVKTTGTITVTLSNRR